MIKSKTIENAIKEYNLDSFIENQEKQKFSNEDFLYKTFKKLHEMIQEHRFTIDKSGVKTVELIAWQCKGLNPWQPTLDFGNNHKSAIEYIKKEIGWYLTQNRSVEEIGKIAKIWQQVADKNGLINSNYGWCIYSEENNSQFENVINELINMNDSRRATMIYTRPSMWEDFNKDGMSDYICTWGTHIFIRNNKLYYIINQRSCDLWFGLRNDLAWHCFVYQQLFNALKEKGINLDKSYDGIVYNCDTLHIYERHFNIVEDIVNIWRNNEH